MISGSNFILKTIWETWVCYDLETNNLVHVRPQDCSLNLVFSLEGSKVIIEQPKAPEFIAIGETNYRLSDVTFYYEQGSNQIMLKVVNEYFATAHPRGSFDSYATECGHWGLFSFVSFDEALSIRESKNRPPPIAKFRRHAKIPFVLNQIVLNQTFKISSLPDVYLMNIERIRNENPELSYVLWTDQDIHDFIYDIYGWEILSAYLKIHPRYGACRADLFRYLCLYKNGGIYLDMKSSLARPLKEILYPDDGYILAQWSAGENNHSELSHVEGGEYQQWHIISSPGHPFLEAVISRVLKNIYSYKFSQFGTGQYGALRVTGPIAYTLAIHEIINLYPHRFLTPTSAYLTYDVIGADRLAHFPGYRELQNSVIL